MIEAGQQQIGYKPLLKLLQQARAELTAELQFPRIGAGEFIDRIEYRSSLLMQTGHAVVDDELQAIYEFRHLTFQEYLAARGFVEEQYPGRDAGRELNNLLEPHFAEERWREVIPLAALLAGRKADPVIERLTSACATAAADRFVTMGSILHRCLLDEVQVNPATLANALRLIARDRFQDHHEWSLAGLLRGKFGVVLRRIVEDMYFGGDDWDQYTYAMGELAALDGENKSVIEDACERAEMVDDCLQGEDRIAKTHAALICMDLAWRCEHGHEKRVTETERAVLEGFGARWRESIGTMLNTADPQVALVASWALLWMGDSRLPPTPPEADVLLALYRLARDAQSKVLARFARHAFASQPLLPRESFADQKWEPWSRLWPRYENDQEEVFGGFRIVLAWYLRKPWNDADLAKQISRIPAFARSRTMSDILATLGNAGKGVLEEWGSDQDGPSKS
jgi:predicted NBD/HSP70 family sugar kinase